MQTTEDLNKLSYAVKVRKRIANRILAILTITLMLGIGIQLTTTVYTDLIALSQAPRPDNRNEMTWLISFVCALVIYFEIYLFGIVKRSMAKVKLYTTE